ncbi:hypothetical protein [Lysinibacillus xylanilyticus]|uniref:hypothetical protein n=1 Tax=Lysinibacillus xylanilyticus TaxID=582475 RepID=UPI003D06A094
MTQIERAIKIAYERGYRVSDCGVIYGIRGKPLSVKKGTSNIYPAFTLNKFEQSITGTYKIPIHRFAAYCFYKDDALVKGVVIRHIDGNVLNFSKQNIAIGTQSENHFDIPEEIRVMRATRLTVSDILEIRKSRSLGERVSIIADKYSVTPKTVYKIIKKETFKNVN